MGSKSDWETMSNTTTTLDELGIEYEVRVASAHRTPAAVVEYTNSARERGLKVIISRLS